jgi:hypothetical protein
MIIRPFDPEKDTEAIRRVWQEVGWFEKGKKEHEEGLDCLIRAGRAIVGEIDGTAECLVMTTSGSMQYLDTAISLSGVSGVTTSRVARKQGLASRMTARAIATDAALGFLISGLEMFEQGFYDQLGYGTGCYTHGVAFDPKQLSVDYPRRPPKRITRDDWEAVHQSRRNKKTRHGAITLDSPNMTRAGMLATPDAFGLGFHDGPEGELTHHVWVIPEKGEHGPYSIRWMSYQTWEQFLELMGVIKTWGEQIHLVRMDEPADIQVQDLLQRPIYHKSVTADSKFETSMWTGCGWQKRICDLAGCLERTHLECAEMRFNLVLSDPIERYLDDDSPWRGCGGSYVVTLGERSGAEAGTDPEAPTLMASVNAFTRLWLGVRPATGLAVTDELSGPTELIDQLDRAFRLPLPIHDWDF